MFDGYLPREKVKIVPNYFDPELLIPEDLLNSKFAALNPVHILFLGNLIHEKGFMLLLEAFLSLPEATQEGAALHFAGLFKSPAERRRFEQRISDRRNVIYHGVVAGNKKRDLLWQSHVFCLPTFYRYEGQPISILEAYAAGCVVITTNNGGIRDVFVKGQHGEALDLEDVSVPQLAALLRKVLSMLGSYQAVAHHNRREAAARYTRSVFCARVEDICFE